MLTHAVVPGTTTLTASFQVCPPPEVNLHRFLLLKLLSRYDFLWSSSGPLFGSVLLLFHGLIPRPLASYSSSTPERDFPTVCSFHPAPISRALLYCCLAILRARKRARRDTLLVNHHFIWHWQAGAEREELQPDVQNFPFGLLKLLTK